MNILIVGLGSIAKKHIFAIRQIVDDVKIYALRSGFGSNEKYEGVHDIYDLSNINLEELDFVVISNPTSERFETLKELIEINKPLFIEKPLFSQINKNTKDLVDSFAARGLSTYVACNLRFLDSIRQIKKIIENERINEVNVYCGSYLPAWRPEVDFRTSYSANAHLGGGVHIDLIHELDYVFWLWGEPQQRSSFFSNQSSLSITSYDYANYLWSYGNFSASIILNYYRRDSKRTLEIVTEEGTYNVDLISNNIRRNGVIVFSSEQRIIDTYKPQMAYFIDNVLKGKTSFNNVQEANRVLELCMQD